MHVAPIDLPEMIKTSILAPFNPVPYILPVPAVVARTQEQYVIWTKVWPVAMVVIREGPKAVPITPGWERSKREWIGKEIGKVWREAQAAGARGEVSLLDGLSWTFSRYVGSLTMTMMMPLTSIRLRVM